MMTIKVMPKADVAMLVQDQASTFEPFLKATPDIWVGFADDLMVCVWGLIPPTIMSDRAYLWLYTTEALRGNEFAFIRHSQRWLEIAFQEYTEVYGHVSAGATQSIRWIRHCGAVFGEPLSNGLIPFSIRKRLDGRSSNTHSN